MQPGRLRNAPTTGEDRTHQTKHRIHEDSTAVWQRALYRSHQTKHLIHEDSTAVWQRALYRSHQTKHRIHADITALPSRQTAFLHSRLNRVARNLTSTQPSDIKRPRRTKWEASFIYIFVVPCITSLFYYNNQRDAALTLKSYRWCILYTSYSYFCLTSIYVNLPSPTSIYPRLDSLRR